MTRTAKRYDCPNRGKDGAGAWHDSGDGRAPRKKCRGCGGVLTTESGMWGVFTHSSVTGDAHYRPENAHEQYTREAAAESAARRCSNRVVRWISA